MATSTDELFRKTVARLRKSGKITFEKIDYGAELESMERINEAMERASQESIYKQRQSLLSATRQVIM